MRRSGAGAGRRDRGPSGSSASSRNRIAASACRRSGPGPSERRPTGGPVGVADVDRPRAIAIAGRHGCRAVTDYHELLPDVEAVSVVTPTLLHHVIARTCLAAGRHVLVEKPLAATVSEARDLVAAAADRGVTLQVGHIERFNAAFRATRGAIKEPTLIECRRWAPFTPRAADDGHLGAL